jgi:hypothetical protein
VPESAQIEAIRRLYTVVNPDKMSQVCGDMVGMGGGWSGVGDSAVPMSALCLRSGYARKRHRLKRAARRM